jgi:cytochrome c-type biogenesis protein CcmH/NrfG
LGRTTEAAEHLAAAVRTFPDYPDARYHLGINLAQLGRSGEAVAQWKRAIELGLPQNDAADAVRRIQTINMQSP